MASRTIPRTRPKRKVLFVCHNHPSVYPGGAESIALEVYEAMRESEEFEPIFLARIGSTVATERRPHLGAPISAVNGDPNQYFLFTETSDFDFFHMSVRNKDLYTRHFRDFLVAHRPDVIHFQHTQFLGFDVIRESRNVLPEAPIIYTLHEYLPICHRDGQMVRTRNQELCLQESPRRCHECFPSISPQSFFLRKRFIQSHLSLVDLFIAPSRFLLEQYVAWGIPRERIRCEDNGRQSVEQVREAKKGRPRNRLGFFGQLSPFKGADVLLEAMRILRGRDADVHLWLYGANLELQPEDFRSRLEGLLKATKRNVTWVGRYEPTEIPKLMSEIDWVVVPSIWWENSPLVIQEAFLHGRPVICSDVGGMAEKVADGVDGLHFRRGDPLNLAETIHRAVESPRLWKRLRGGIPPVRRIEEHVAALTDIYRTLLAGGSLET